MSWQGVIRVMQMHRCFTLVGNSGNEFRYLQIVDSDLYDFALACLASVTRVKIYHVEQIHGNGRPDKSDTYIWRIETKPG